MAPGRLFGNKGILTFSTKLVLIVSRGMHIITSQN